MRKVIFLDIDGVLNTKDWHSRMANYNNGYDERRNERFNDRLSFGDEFTKGERMCNSYNVTERETNGNNARLDLQTPHGKPQQTQSNASGKEY